MKYIGVISLLSYIEMVEFFNAVLGIYLMSGTLGEAHNCKQGESI